MPNDVAILGDVDDWGRRDYPKLWAKLIEAIQGEDSAISLVLKLLSLLSEEPFIWGYTISPENGHFMPSTETSDVQPFRIHIFGGKKEGIVIPEELLEHVLVFHSGLDYVDYYRELSNVVSQHSSSTSTL